jgi:hypothetical protein
MIDEDRVTAGPIAERLPPVLFRRTVQARSYLEKQIVAAYRAALSIRTKESCGPHCRRAC